MATDQRKAWITLAADLPWLCRSDRRLVELTAALQVRLMQPDCPLGAYAQMRLCLASLGATPVDRSKVQIENHDPNDLSEFFN